MPDEFASPAGPATDHADSPSFESDDAAPVSTDQEALAGGYCYYQGTPYNVKAKVCIGGEVNECRPGGYWLNTRQKCR